MWAESGGASVGDVLESVGYCYVVAGADADSVDVAVDVVSDSSDWDVLGSWYSVVAVAD